MADPFDRSARVLVAYYSATGHVRALAKAVAQGAELEGAEVRVRPVEELAPELLISQNQAWGRHRSEVGAEPTATLGDLEWADGVAFGTPTRFGNVAAQLKMFLDEAGELWQQGKLVNKVITAFTSSQTAHGGQESTILALNNTFYHWGSIVLPLGYTVGEVFNGGRQSVRHVVHQRYPGRCARRRHRGGRERTGPPAGACGQGDRDRAGARTARLQARGGHRGRRPRLGRDSSGERAADDLLQRRDVAVKRGPAAR